jgi:DNA-binding NarL/FixJ family response regulator
MLAFDKRASVPDQVTAKIDVAAWFSTLTQRMKEIARDLALGFSTSEVARKHELCASRISQIRRMLETSWDAFQGENPPARA